MAKPVNPFYARHYALDGFSDSEQQALQNSRVLIVGCGGLGNLATMYLCTAGVEQLLINDFDTVDQSNLQRQLLFQPDDIGQNKALVAQKKLASLNPDCQVNAITKRLTTNELRDTGKGVDLILDCSDNFATRLNVNQVSVDNKIPLISGAAIRFEGQLSFFDPNNAESPCYQCLHQGETESIEDCAGNGILAPVTGVIASSMAVEAIKFITGIGTTLVGRLQLYDARHAHWREIKINKDPKCKVCKG